MGGIVIQEMDPKEYIFGGIFALSNRLQLLGDRLNEPVTIKQWLLLAVLSKWEHSAPALSEVAETMGVSRQSVKKMALLLEKQGFVTLKKDEADARIVRISLTPQCSEYYRSRSDAGDRFFAALYWGFTDEQIEGLYEGLIKLTENIAAMESQNEN